MSDTVKVRRYQSGEPLELDLSPESGGPHDHDARYVQLTDPRLTDAREPLEHEHPTEPGGEPEPHTHTLAELGAASADVVDAMGTELDTHVTELEGKVDLSDPRLTDARAPTPHPHPELAPAEVVTAVDALADELAGKVDGTDPRLSDARAPTAHGDHLTQAAVDASIEGQLDGHETTRDHLSPAAVSLAAAEAVDGHVSVAPHVAQASIDAAIAAAVDAHELEQTHGGGPGGDVAGVVPVGGIILWSGSIASIPSGWVLCNGSNGTPDLRDRFVLGAGTTAVGATGGSSSHGHDAHTDVVSHDHGVTVSDPGHAHVEQHNNATTGSLRGWGAADTSTGTPTATGYSTSPAQTGVGVDVQPAGVASLPHSSSDHRPSFYALAYLMRVA